MLRTRETQRPCPRCGGKKPGIGRLCPLCAKIERELKEIPAEKRLKRPARQNPDRNPAHLEWIRSLPCSVRGCYYSSQAAHVRLNTGGGMGLKPPDKFSAPLCAEHHHEQHQIGHRAFDAKYGLDLRALAEELSAMSPHASRN